MKRSFDARTGLALAITFTALVGITILGVVIIVTSDATINTRAQTVFNAVLPLFGTWVGTVLAYYFSRENFEAASASTQLLVRQLSPEERLRSTPVTLVMTTSIYSVKDLKAKVEAVRQDLEKKKIKRLPILKASGALEALLYLEGIGSYLIGVTDADRPQKTLEDLLKEKPSLKQAPAFVSEAATLAEAKEAMEKIPDCKVVFVTSSGDPGDPILGLLTNTDVAKHSRA